MPRKLRSRCSDAQFQEALRTSISVAEVLRALNLTPSGANYKFFHGRVALLSLDTSHLRGKGYLKGRTHSWTERIPTVDILVQNSTYPNTSALKAWLLGGGVFVHRWA